MTEGMAGQEPRTESWRTDDNRTLVVHYDHRGITEVTREALTELLIAAGLERATEGER